MAHTLSALRNIRKNDKRRLHNKAIKSQVRSQVRRVLEAIGRKDRPAAESELRRASSLLDRAARKNVIHRNAASRHKARLAARIAALAAPATPTA